MREFINIADLDSGNGKTYREINNEKNHGMPIGQLVEIDSGVRLFISRHKRDCDGTPLYVLSPFSDETTRPYQTQEIHGYAEECLTIINQTGE